MKVLSVLFVFLQVNLIFAYVDVGIFKEVGSYQINETESSSVVKYYYLSQNYETSWTGAFYFCMSHNMDLLSFDSNDEFTSFTKSSKTSRSDFSQETYIDGIKLKDESWQLMTNGKSLNMKEVYRFVDTLSQGYYYNQYGHQDYGAIDTCLTLYKNQRPSFKFNPVGCKDQKRKFLCQDIKTVTNYSNPKNIKTLTVDVPSTFFKVIGSFNTLVETDEFNVKKTYYLSRNYQLTPMKASSACKSFDMKLVDLESKNEFEYLIRNIAQNANKMGQKIIVGGFQSQMKRKSWYNLFRNRNDAHDTSRKCTSVLVDQSSQNGMFYSLDCNNDKMSFICESSESSESTETDSKLLEYFEDKKLISIRGMEKFSEYEIPSQNGTELTSLKTYYMSSFEDATWMDAFFYCKVMGLNLYSPIDEVEEAHVFESLNDNYGKSRQVTKIFIGGTRAGSEIFWYWIQSGQQIDYELPWLDDALDSYYCLKLEKSTNNFHYKDTQCDEVYGRFICEKTTISYNVIAPEQITEKQLPDSVL